MESYWFGDRDGQVCQPAPKDPAILTGRIELLAERGAASIPDWRIAVRCGFFRDRAEYVQVLREAAINLATKNLERGYRADNSGLIQMVRMLEQIDLSINLLTERAVDWYRATRPGFSRKLAVPSGRNLITWLHEDADEALGGVLDEIEHLMEQRTSLAKRVSQRAEGVLPNCSALVGGLVAARLAAEAGGIRELAMMPASSIQVLGAKQALFCHLSSGSPPPKHGVIYQHGRVHGARKENRGKVARTLSTKLAIAARIDYYRKEPDREFLEKAAGTIRKAGRKA
jgi:nucleolar protein 56